MVTDDFAEFIESQSPLTGQFNFYKLTYAEMLKKTRLWSQSPLTGQFNFYRNGLSLKSLKSLKSLNPL